MIRFAVRWQDSRYGGKPGHGYLYTFRDCFGIKCQVFRWFTPSIQHRLCNKRITWIIYFL